VCFFLHVEIGDAGFRLSVLLQLQASWHLLSLLISVWVADENVDDGTKDNDQELGTLGPMEPAAYWPQVPGDRCGSLQLDSRKLPASYGSVSDLILTLNGP
jgi:hypothetical protein